MKWTEVSAVAIALFALFLSGFNTYRAEYYRNNEAILSLVNIDRAPKAPSRCATNITILDPHKNKDKHGRFKSICSKISIQVSNLGTESFIVSKLGAIVLYESLTKTASNIQFLKNAESDQAVKSLADDACSAATQNNNHGNWQAWRQDIEFPRYNFIPLTIEAQENALLSYEAFLPIHYGNEYDTPDGSTRMRQRIGILCGVIDLHDFAGRKVTKAFAINSAIISDTPKPYWFLEVKNQRQEIFKLF